MIALNFFLIKIVPQNIMPDERNYAFLRCIYNLAIVIRSKNKRIGFQNFTPKTRAFFFKKVLETFFITSRKLTLRVSLAGVRSRR